MAVTIHTRNAEMLGEAFWDIHAPWQLAPRSSLVNLPISGASLDARGCATWATPARAAGGAGEPPEDVVLAFALNFSTFATQALMVDFDQIRPDRGVNRRLVENDSPKRRGNSALTSRCRCGLMWLTQSEVSSVRPRGQLNSARAHPPNSCESRRTESRADEER